MSHRLYKTYPITAVDLSDGKSDREEAILELDPAGARVIRRLLQDAHFDSE